MARGVLAVPPRRGDSAGAAGEAAGRSIGATAAGLARVPADALLPARSRTERYQTGLPVAGLGDLAAPSPSAAGLAADAGSPSPPAAGASSAAAASSGTSLVGDVLEKRAHLDRRRKGSPTLTAQHGALATDLEERQGDALRAVFDGGHEVDDLS